MKSKYNSTLSDTYYKEKRMYINKHIERNINRSYRLCENKKSDDLLMKMGLSGFNKKEYKEV